MNLHLVDANPQVVRALREYFSAYPEVSVSCANLLDVATHCVVSPANSYGFIDGGIDAAYLEFFGEEIQKKVQSAIAQRPEGNLPVGAALAVRTGHPRIPYLIVAPTMEIPEAVPAGHAGRALRAVLRLIGRHPEVGQEIYCPGLGTLIGRIDPEEAARSMAGAYQGWRQQTCGSL